MIKRFWNVLGTERVYTWNEKESAKMQARVETEAVKGSSGTGTGESGTTHYGAQRGSER